jgi:hypothetical protein
MKDLTIDELEAGLNGDLHREYLAEIIKRAREHDDAKKEIWKAKYVWFLQHRCAIQHIHAFTHAG